MVPRTEDIDCTRGQQRNNQQREQRLQHHQYFCSPGEHGRVGRGEGSVGVEGQKQVVDKIGGPVLLAGIFERVLRHCHLGKEEKSECTISLVGLNRYTVGSEADASYLAITQEAPRKIIA